MEREQERLEEFRRLRREIGGSQEYLVVGIDISKDNHDALMRTPGGKIVYRRLSFHNTREGFASLLVQVEAMRVQHGLKRSRLWHGTDGELSQTAGRVFNQPRAPGRVGLRPGGQTEPLAARWPLEQGREGGDVVD